MIRFQINATGLVNLPTCFANITFGSLGCAFSYLALGRANPVKCARCVASSSYLRAGFNSDYEVRLSAAWLQSRNIMRLLLMEGAGLRCGLRLEVMWVLNVITLIMNLEPQRCHVISRRCEFLDLSGPKLVDNDILELCDCEALCCCC